MYSLSYLYQALGENWYADRAELAAFNALPGALTPDWWARQYMAEPNQPWSKNLTETPFSDVNTVGQMFTLEGNYPCCTVNHPQGYPKFLSASFVQFGVCGLAHALLGPANVTTRLSCGAAVNIIATTNYPFDLDLIYIVTATEPFSFAVRVPTWADATKSTIATITGPDGPNNTVSVSPDVDTGMHTLSISSGTTMLRYSISTSLRLEPRPNATVAVYYGALLYGLAIPFTSSSTAPHDYATQELLPAGYAPPASRDWTLLPTAPWNYAIDPATLVYHYDGSAAPGKVLPDPIWALGAPPNYVTVKACLIDWPLYLGSVPGRVPLRGARQCVGAVEEVELRPYGSTKLHVVDLPTVDLGTS